MSNLTSDGAPSKKKAPWVDIMGVKVSLIDPWTLNEEIRGVVRRGERALVLNVNVHCMNLAHRLPWLRRMLNAADIVFCDGFGVVIAARILGKQVPVRITYADWMWELSAHAQTHGLSLFFLGGRPGVAEKAAARLQRTFPGLRILGAHHGYFDKTPGSAENEAVVREINAARPDVLLVGFGMPLQERWLMENWDRVAANVALTGGGLFDIVSGVLRRGPRWMTDHGLEWLARLLLQPRHVWRRYLIGNPLFLCRVLAHRLHARSAAHGAPAVRHSHRPERVEGR